jgi:uncharacterized SAM-binding protein YcdF (DUF218 family)
MTNLKLSKKRIKLKQSKEDETPNNTANLVIFVIAIVFLTAVTVWNHVWFQGWDALGKAQLFRHNQILSGTAFQPWAYRLLPEWYAEVFLRLLGVEYGFIFARSLVSLGVFIVFYLYLRILKIDGKEGLLALLLFSSGMLWTIWDNSDLSIGTFLELLFSLGAGIVVLKGRYAWLLLIAGLSALTKESFIIVLISLLFATSFNRIVLGSAILFGVVFLCNYLVVGPREYLLAYGNLPGLGLAKFNLSKPETYLQVGRTLSFIPLLSVVRWKEWPSFLKKIAIVLIPVWFLAVLFGGIVCETRLLLVPQALVFIPGLFVNAKSSG